MKQCNIEEEKLISKIIQAISKHNETHYKQPDAIYLGQKEFNIIKNNKEFYFQYNNNKALTFFGFSILIVELEEYFRVV